MAISQAREVRRDGRLGQTERVGQVDAPAFSGGQLVHDCQPGGIAQAAEQGHCRRQIDPACIVTSSDRHTTVISAIGAAEKTCPVRVRPRLIVGCVAGVSEGVELAQAVVAQRCGEVVGEAIEHHTTLLTGEHESSGAQQP